jgi:hypothetical protein
MHRALFVTHQNVPDRVLLENLVIDGQHGAAGIAEYDLDALIFQRLDHHLCSGHLPCHRICPFRSVRVIISTVPSDTKKPPGG